MSFFGEAVTDPAEAEQAVDEYCAVAEAVGDASELDVPIGVKPTLKGLGISQQAAESGLLEIVETAAANRVRVKLDLETTDTVEAKLDLYRVAVAGSERTGVVLQSYVWRTLSGARALSDEGIARVRLTRAS